MLEYDFFRFVQARKNAHGSISVRCQPLRTAAFLHTKCCEDHHSREDALGGQLAAYETKMQHHTFHLAGLGMLVN